MGSDFEVENGGYPPEVGGAGEDYAGSGLVWGFEVGCGHFYSGSGKLEDLSKLRQETKRLRRATINGSYWGVKLEIWVGFGGIH